MHPTYSIIYFTSASGAGYGLLFLLGLGVAANPSFLGSAAGRPAFAIALVFALVLVSAGLVSSAFHLGRPERALRAFTQWRTSWLSREACLAAATYVPALLLGVAWWGGGPGGAFSYLGVLLAVGAAATVYSTAMIYRSLAAVPRWSTGWVPATYLSLALASGAVWLAFIASLFDPGGVAAGMAGAAAVLIGVAAAAKGGYWRTVDRLSPESTIESATGLGRLDRHARVHVLDPPHTEPNWLQREMGYRVARRHARRLRAMAWGLAFALPGLLCFGVWVTEAAGGAAGNIALALAAVVASAGILVERWLFFAEAQHRMNLYYGTRGV